MSRLIVVGCAVLALAACGKAGTGEACTTPDDCDPSLLCIRVKERQFTGDCIPGPLQCLKQCGASAADCTALPGGAHTCQTSE